MAEQHGNDANAQAVIGALKQMKHEQQQMERKLGELEVEANEHKLVIETMNKVEGSRRCYRLVGGVLVERTAAEVLPAVQTNFAKLNEVIVELQKQLDAKTTQINEHVAKYKIRTESMSAVAAQQQAQQAEAKDGAPAGAAAKDGAAKGASGVLV
eukprot:TRINITY_DN3265_c0_g1_i1.p2 TRINITY_DN3265_c0_g1~~TRINITY_DN3265_c0_g1_i1.p2  ORF type:complete len:172 (+),score=78.54 TRINITY_DN3265_c0_g1_i1:52-516(+)